MTLLFDGVPDNTQFVSSLFRTAITLTRPCHGKPSVWLFSLTGTQFDLHLSQIELSLTPLSLSQTALDLSHLSHGQHSFQLLSHEQHSVWLLSLMDSTQFDSFPSWTLNSTSFVLPLSRTACRSVPLIKTLRIWLEWNPVYTFKFPPVEIISDVQGITVIYRCWKSWNFLDFIYWPRGYKYISNPI